MPRFSRKRSASTKKNGKRRRKTMRTVRRSTKKASTFKTRSKSVVRRARKRFGLRRRVRRGGDAKAMLRMFAKRVHGGSNGKGPIDQLIVTSQTAALNIDPDSSSTSVFAGWGWGTDVGTMLTNIRAEAPSTLLGGAVLMQPELIVYGYSTFDILPVGNAPIDYELILATPRKGVTAAATLATLGTAFAAAWALSYDAVPSGFSTFPDTSLLQNTQWWQSSNSGGGFKPIRRITGRANVGQPRRYVFKFKTRRFKYQEYSASTFLTEGQVGGKTHALWTKVRAIRGQVCGVKSAVNQPILTEIGAPYMMKMRHYYFYRWVAGNNRPTIYGSNLGTSESVNEDALSWIGVPALRSQRQSANIDPSAGFVDYGATDQDSLHQVGLNPIWNCEGERTTPSVSMA